MKVYAWLIDLIYRWKNCPTGMISGWVQEVTEHRGTIHYSICGRLHFLFDVGNLTCPVFPAKRWRAWISWSFWRAPRCRCWLDCVPAPCLPRRRLHSWPCCKRFCNHRKIWEYFTTQQMVLFYSSTGYVLITYLFSVEYTYTGILNHRWHRLLNKKGDEW